MATPVMNEQRKSNRTAMIVWRLLGISKKPLTPPPSIRKQFFRDQRQALLESPTKVSVGAAPGLGLRMGRLGGEMSLLSNYGSAMRSLHPVSEAKPRGAGRSSVVSPRRSGSLPNVLWVSVVALFLVQLFNSSVLGDQTREQCNECCKRAGYDEYYEEQCRLKCFRNHDHCIAKAVQPNSPQPAAKEPDREPAPPKERDIQLAWPNPLNLVAGKEGEAAAQILAVNGVSPQHPFYHAALQDIQIVLIDFVRKHPQGGKLPTTQLKRIMKQLK